MKIWKQRDASAEKKDKEGNKKNGPEQKSKNDKINKLKKNSWLT